MNYWIIAFMCATWTALLLLWVDLHAARARMHSLEPKLWKLDRECASNNAGLEMLEPLVTNHERALQGATNLHILHAQALTEIREQVSKLKEDKRWARAFQEDN